jgi:hypothetical protein
MSTNIEGKVVVLTGGSAGLGEDATRYLAPRGAVMEVRFLVDPLILTCIRSPNLLASVLHPSR